MSYSLLQQKREKLQREIDRAEQKLQANFKTFEPLNLIPSYNQILPSQILPGIAIQENTVSHIETVANVVFPNNTYIQSVLKVLRLYFIIKK